MCAHTRVLRVRSVKINVATMMSPEVIFFHIVATMIFSPPTKIMDAKIMISALQKPLVGLRRKSCISPYVKANLEAPEIMDAKTCFFSDLSPCMCMSCQGPKPYPGTEILVLPKAYPGTRNPRNPYRVGVACA